MTLIGKKALGKMCNWFAAFGAIHKVILYSETNKRIAAVELSLEGDWEVVTDATARPQEQPLERPEPSTLPSGSPVLSDLL